MSIGLTVIVNTIISGQIDNSELLSAFPTLRGTSLVKVEGQPDPRPIGIGETLLTLAQASQLALRHNFGSAMQHDVGNFHKVVGPSQLGQCVEGSTDILTFAISAALAEDLERVCLKIDTKNVFNSVSNASLRAAAIAMPQICPLTMLRYGGPITVNFKNHATGEMTTIEQSEGVSQGDTTAGFLYCLAEAPAVKEVQANHDVLVLGYQDDKHFIGKPDEVFAALTCYEGALERATRCVINRWKCQASSFGGDPAELKELCQTHGVSHRDDGIIVAGIPIGRPSLVRKEVDRTIGNALVIVKQFAAMAKTITLKEEGREKHMLYNLFRSCVPSQLNHILRGVDPSFTEDPMTRFDSEVFAMLKAFFPSLARPPSAPDGR